MKIAVFSDKETPGGYLKTAGGLVIISVVS